MKKIVNTQTFKFAFSSENAIELSMREFSRLHFMKTLFILTSVSCLSVKNKKGLDICELCHFLSQTSDDIPLMEMHVFVYHLVRTGFLSSEASLDRDGDKSELIRLTNKEIGEYSMMMFKKGFPEVSDGIDSLKDIDFDVRYKDEDFKTSDTKH